MDGNEKKTQGTISVEEGGFTASEEGKQETSARGIGARLMSLWIGVLYALAGYLLGGATLPFGAQPLGIALLSATDRKPLYVLAGLCLSAWRNEERVLLISIYCSVFLLRLLTRFVLDTPWAAEDGKEMGEKTLGEVFPLLFSEHIGLRMATSAIGVFAAGVYRLIEGGFLFYDLYGTLLSVIVAPVAVLLFGGWFRESVKSEAYHLTGLVSLALALVYAIGDRTVYGVSLSILGCMLFTLYLTRKKGILAGMIAGVVVGIAISPEMSPLFALAALSSGMLFPISRTLALASAFSVGLAWSVYVEGLGILRGSLAALIAATLLFAVLDKLFLGTKEKAEADPVEENETKAAQSVICRPLENAELEGARLSSTHTRIKGLCESLEGLSRIFREMGTQMKSPAAADLRQICEEAMESSCASCPDHDRCWEKEYRETSSAIGGLSAALLEKGTVTSEDAEEGLRARCGRLYDILEEVNYHAARRRRELLFGDRTEVFSLDYGALAELLAATMTKEERVFEIDAEKTRALCDGLNPLMLGIEGVCVWGDGRRGIAVKTDKPLSEEKKGLVRKKIEEICGVFLDEEETREGNMFLFRQRESLRVSCAVRTLCAAGEETYCGDTALTFRSGEGKFYALISDGMGSGREAAMTSGVSGVFLKKILEADQDTETAFRMLNGFLRNRGGGSLHECSTTVDLMELDLVSCRASFHKSGAAPTYVLRSGGLLKLRSRTLPVGILEAPDTKSIRFSLESGDVIVMVSDGVTRGKEECPWLYDLLRGQSEESSAERLADLIVKYAKGEGATDDLSAVVVKISKEE